MKQAMGRAPLALTMLAAAMIVGCEFEEVDESLYSLVLDTTVSADPTGWGYASFPKKAGYRYTACLNPTTGNPDLYGDYRGRPTSQPGGFQYSSTNPGSKDECFSFNAEYDTGDYHLGVFWVTPGGTADLWVTESAQEEVPPGFEYALMWPLQNHRWLVNGYSEYNTSWGNPEEKNIPFFPKAKNEIHRGVDILVPRNRDDPDRLTNVMAACDGPIVAVGRLSDMDDPVQWGFYVVQECKLDKTTLTLAYDHLNETDRPALGSFIRKGDGIGTIFDLNVEGEDDHLHFGICKGKFKKKGKFHNNGKCDPQKGAFDKDGFPGYFINPWVLTNPGLFNEP